MKTRKTAKEWVILVYMIGIILLFIAGLLFK